MEPNKHVLVGILTVGILSILVCVTASASSGDQDRGVPLHACHNSDWMTEAGGVGSGVEFKTSLRPTNRARAIGWAANPLTGESNIKYIWRDLKRCVTFPALTTAQSQSLYMQLVCHAFWAHLPIRQDGGPTWDLEAWRANQPKSFAIDPRRVKQHRCNWPPERPPARQGAAGRAKYYFTTWKAAPGFRSLTCSYDDPKCTVGELRAGRNYFYCQSKSSRGDVVGPYRNHWWLFTDLDSPAGAKGWVSAVYVTVGGQEQPIPGLPAC